RRSGGAPVGGQHPAAQAVERHRAGGGGREEAAAVLGGVHLRSPPRLAKPSRKRRRPEPRAPRRHPTAALPTCRDPFRRQARTPPAAAAPARSTRPPPARPA